MEIQFRTLKSAALSLVLILSGCTSFVPPLLEFREKVDISASPAAHAVTRANAVVHREVLRWRRISIIFPGEKAVIAARERGYLAADAGTWVGRIVGEKDSRVVISYNAQAVAGIFFRGDHSIYELRGLGHDEYRLEKFDSTHARPEHDPRLFLVDLAGQLPTPQLPCTTDVSSDIDVLVVYTSSVFAAFGNDVHELDEFIAAAVRLTDVSFKDSSVAASVKLAHAESTSYIESGHVDTDLLRLETPNDNELDDVQSLRDQYGADVVVLLVDTNDGAGVANIMEKIDPIYEAAAYAVVPWEYALRNSSFVHELGHLLGARHEWNDDGTDGKPDHANHGFAQPYPTIGNPWRTVMATPSACVCERLPRWSNPHVKLPSGDDAGDPNEPKPADNHATVERAAATVAKFRCHQTGIVH